MQNSSVENCLSLINTEKVMTIGTVSDKGAWSAPVYYYYSGKTFFFFSSLDSRHIKDGLNSEFLCAASVFEDHESFDKIKGVQMSGRILKAGIGTASSSAVAGYVKKFRIKICSSDAMRFLENQYHAKLFKFVPEQIFLMDNSKGFGTKQEIEL